MHCIGRSGIGIRDLPFAFAKAVRAEGWLPELDRLDFLSGAARHPFTGGRLQARDWSAAELARPRKAYSPIALAFFWRYRGHWKRHSRLTYPPRRLTV